MSRSNRIFLVWAVAVLTVITLIFVDKFTSHDERGLFPHVPTQTASHPTPSRSGFIGPTLGFEIVPVSDDQKDQVMERGVPLVSRCAPYLGETYFAHIPPPDHPGAHSKLDINGAILMVARLSDGSVQVLYDGEVTGFVLGDDFAVPPGEPADKFWINPESFGPIIETKIGVCIQPK